MGLVNLVKIELPTGYIYAYTDLENGKSYIGSTMDVERRKAEHLETALHDPTRNDKFHAVLREKGEEGFSFEVIATKKVMSQKGLTALENYYINFYNTIEFGYNSKQEKDDE